MRLLPALAACLAVTTVTLAAGPPAAEGGSPITKLGPCTNSYLQFKDGFAGPLTQA